MTGRKQDNKDTEMKSIPESMSAPRYSGIATFMRTPLVKDPSGLDIAFIGVPYDGAVEGRSGARHGPREIRNKSSMIRTIHHLTRINPFKLCNIADIGDVSFTNVYRIEDVHNDIFNFFKKLHEVGVVPLTAGGDHSITLPILKALGKKTPVGLVHIDAHTDTNDMEMGSKFSHGTPFRRAVEEGILNAERTVQIGIRGAQNSEEGWDFSSESGMCLIFMEEFTRLGVEGVIDQIQRIIGDGSTYISFDIDSLDPAYAPGTGTPEIGGLTTVEAQTLLRGLRGLNLIGADVVEVSPPFDSSGSTALVAATILYEILCLLAESKAHRKS
ncbi:MAG: agmatinase [Candidatus Hodarchaeota archaeon]